MGVNSPSLWLTLMLTAIQVTILLFGGVKFFALIEFCKSSNASGNYAYVKSILLILMYSYAPLVVMSTTFSWVAFGQDWNAGWVFIWLPFTSVVLFMTVVMVSHNDISNYVDIQREARSKLPAQRLPPPLVIGVAPPPGMSAVRPLGPMVHETTVLELPPPLPVSDDDALPPPPPYA